MGKLVKVTLEFDDKILTIEGSEAEKWNNHNTAIASLAVAHGANPFDSDPVKWSELSKSEAIQEKDGANEEEIVKRLIIAFLQGTEFWEYHTYGATMWPSDKTVCLTEAQQRAAQKTLGEPSPLMTDIS